MAEIYEIVIFTASLSQYAKPLINELDKNSVGYLQLYREHWTFHKSIYFVKDLSKLGRDLKNVVFIDNTPSAYMFHPENAIPIISWYNNPHDKELIKLIPFLTSLSEVEDVRKFIAKPKVLTTTPAPCSPKVESKLFQSDDKRNLISSNSKRILIQKKNNNFLKTVDKGDWSSPQINKTEKSQINQDNITTDKVAVQDSKLERLKTSRRKLRASIKNDKLREVCQNSNSLQFLKFIFY